MAVQFFYEAAVVAIDTIFPSSGLPAGGTAVVIYGRGFVAGAAVTFGGIAATGVVVVSDAQIQAVNPAHGAGAVDVVVTNVDSTSATLAHGFSYQATPPRTDIGYYAPGGARGGRMRTGNNPPHIHQALGQPSTFTFTAPTEPAGESSVEFSVGGVQLFLGSVTRKTERVDGRQRQQCWDVEATDLAHRLGRRRPTGEWTATPAATVIHALLSTFAPDVTAVIESGLVAVTVLLDGATDLLTVISDVCKQCGAKWFIVGTAIHVFTLDSGYNPPAPVTNGNPDLLWTDSEHPVTIGYDYTGLANRVTVIGAEGLTASLDDPTSMALYGLCELTISDNTLETTSELLTRARVELVARAKPVLEVHYATRDLLTGVGRTVTITIDRPAINGQFIIESVDIDQLDIADRGLRAPRFIVVAKPATAAFVRASGPTAVVELLQKSMGVAAGVHTQPKMDGDVTADRGGRTTIPEGSIPASKLAGCITGDKIQDKTITSDQLDDTGVAAGTYGGAAHLTTYTVGSDGRILSASTDPVAVVKTDGSQAYTADQSLGGHKVTNGATPTAAGDLTTKAYVDAAVASGGGGGSVPWSSIVGEPTTLAGYGITDAQPLDAQLTALAGLADAVGVLTNNGSGLLSWTVPSGGGGGSGGGGATWVMLEEHIAAGSAALNFTAWLAADYDDYVVELVNILPATDAAILQVQVSTNGGASYDAGANYWSAAHRWSASGQSQSGTATTYFDLTGGLGVASDVGHSGLSGALELYNPAGTTGWKHLKAQSTLWYPGTPELLGTVFAGAYKSATAINALRVKMSTGNLASGTVRIYGIKKVTGTGGGSSGPVPWTSITGTPTTLAGYGITDAQPLDAELSALAALANAPGVLTNNGAGVLSWAPASSGSVAWSSITGTPTTLAGYGITDAQPKDTQLTAIAALADAPGFLTNNGSGGMSWTAASAVPITWSQITGTPTTLAGYGITDAAPLVHTHTFAAITGKPTTLAGYGITDAQPLDAELSALAALANTAGVLTNNGSGGLSWAAASGGGGGTVTGTGTAGTIPKWTSSTALGNSVIVEASGKIGIGLAPAYTLDVNGDINLPDSSYIRGGGNHLATNIAGNSYFGFAGDTVLRGGSNALKVTLASATEIQFWFGANLLWKMYNNGPSDYLAGGPSTQKVLRWETGTNNIFSGGSGGLVVRNDLETVVLATITNTGALSWGGGASIASSSSLLTGSGTTGQLAQWSSGTLTGGIVATNVALLNANNTFTGAAPIILGSGSRGALRTDTAGYFTAQGGSTGYQWLNNAANVAIMTLSDGGVLTVPVQLDLPAESFGGDATGYVRIAGGSAAATGSSIVLSGESRPSFANRVDIGAAGGLFVAGALAVTGGPNVMSDALAVNNTGVVVSGFWNGVKLAGWDAFGYEVATSSIALGGYRAGQYGAVGLYTGGARRWGVNAAGDFTVGASSNVCDSVGAPTIVSGFGGIAGIDGVIILTCVAGQTSGVVNFGHTFTNPPGCAATWSTWAGATPTISASATTTQVSVSWGATGAPSGAKLQILVRGY